MVVSEEGILKDQMDLINLAERANEAVIEREDIHDHSVEDSVSPSSEIVGSVQMRDSADKAKEHALKVDPFMTGAPGEEIPGEPMKSIDLADPVPEVSQPTKSDEDRTAFPAKDVPPEYFEDVSRHIPCDTHNLH